MPELPEVELASRALGRIVWQRQIVSAELRRPRLLVGTTPEEFASRLHGATFLETGRRGKHILLHFDLPLVLIVHLRMTGRFLYLSPEAALPKHTHAIFYLDNDYRLIFVDQRQFGFMRLTDTDSLWQTKELINLAPEPLSDAFSPALLYGTLQCTRRPIKEVLLDQSRVSGLGNIYAAEALFISGINPQAASNSISRLRARRLHRAIVDVLNESIAHGSTMNVENLSDVELNYYGGPFEDHWRVYDREGNPCGRCGTKILRIVQGSRSTYYCPRCQRN